MEWLPGNKEYDLAGKYNIEWYSADGDPDSTDYESAIWIPVIPEKVKSYHAIRKLPYRCAKRQGISYFMSVPG